MVSPLPPLLRGARKDGIPLASPFKGRCPEGAERFVTPINPHLHGRTEQLPQNYCFGVSRDGSL